MSIEEEILELLAIANYKDRNAPKAEIKRDAAYMVGVKLAEKREELRSDNSFGDWCRSCIVEKCMTNINTSTLFRYQKLAEYGTRKECEQVGFTNVYKLMEKDNQHLIQKIKESVNPKDQVKHIFNPPAKLNMPSDKVIEVIARMALAAADENSPGDILLYGMYGTAFPNEDDLKKARSTFHPDKGGTADLATIAQSLYKLLKENTHSGKKKSDSHLMTH